MARNPKSGSGAVSEATKTEAAKIAKATQKPGQTKEQTKLIAQGIQKGIDQYKKQHKAKSRELDKQRKKYQIHNSTTADESEITEPQETGSGSKLPWILLILSWLLFAAYITLA
ncbi:DUF2956 domain-containing protein [Amphritea sp. HPY]|uniref:DUF2956 domain-containing protein n=1 Tax=Amphritea sp. HPY TaxID=3421652 RepID=UPI003D7E6E0F